MKCLSVYGEILVWYASIKFSKWEKISRNWDIVRFYWKMRKIVLCICDFMKFGLFFFYYFIILLIVIIIVVAD